MTDNLFKKAFLLAAAAAIALPFCLAPVMPVRAEGGVSLAPVANEAAAKECSACHMAFPAGLLPARSWEAVMKDLPNHFGEDASLPADVTAEITSYLVANAGDAKGQGGRWIRRIPNDQTPLRITETPGWISAHKGEVSPSAFKSPKVKSPANCAACHAGAAKGYFEDD